MSITSTQNITKELIKSPLTLTTSWVNLGDRINTKGLDDIAMWLNGSLNDSDKVMIRVKCNRNIDDTTGYYTQIQTVSDTAAVLSQEIYELNSSNIEAVIPLGVSELAPWIQLEIKVNTAGATAASIAEAFVSFSRG